MTTAVELSFDIGAEAEQAVLSSMLNSADAIAVARLQLQAEDFQSTAHRRLFATMLAIADAGSVVDPLTVANELDRRRELAAVGGKDYLGSLIDAAPFGASVEDHVRIVLDKAQERAALAYLEQMSELVRSGQVRPSEMPDRVETAFAKLRRTSGRFRPIDDRAVGHLPHLEYLVDGMIPVESLIAIYGPPASGKSFATLDLACSVATGTPWLGHAVRRRGPVLYVAAEGTVGVGQRVAAWKQSRCLDDELIGVWFIRSAVNLLELRDCSDFLAEVQQMGRRPALIVFDTLHRSMAGGDENSAKDVGVVVENLDRIRRQTGAAVLVVHHSRKDSDVERGSTSLRGAVDTLIQVKTAADSKTLICEKQKDGPSFIPISFATVPLFGSCVVKVLSRQEAESGSTLTPQQYKALSVLSSHFLESGATATQWLEAAEIPQSSFWRTRTHLVREGYVSEKKVGNGGRYVLTPSGRSAITLNSHDALRELSPDLLPNSQHFPAPLGAGVSESWVGSWSGSEHRNASQLADSAEFGDPG